MSVSDLAKAALVSHYSAQGLKTGASDWKRRSKGALGDHVVRVFENQAAGLRAIVTTCDEEDLDEDSPITVWEDGPIGFVIRDHEGGYSLSFTPMSQWERSRTLPMLDDYSHSERGIEALPLRWCGDGIDDNLFAIGDAGTVRRDLIASGYTELDPHLLKEK